MPKGYHTLFFTSDDLTESHNIELSVEQAKKHEKNPLIPLGDLNEWDCGQARPWEGRSIIYDEEDGLFKAWYTGTDATPNRWWKTGYTVSRDGTTWEKPVLELFEFNGNKRNNICAEICGPVLKDTAEKDEEKRFKMFVKHSPNSPDGSAIAYSPDGIHWNDFTELDMSPLGDRKHDSVVFIRDEQDPDPTRRYKTFWQFQVAANKPGPEMVRAKGMAYGPTETDWRPSPYNPILSPNDGLEQENHFLMYIPYEGQYLLPYEYGWYQPNGTGSRGAYTADIRLAHSTDGERFNRVRPDQKMIPRGDHGQWDDQFLVISDKAIIKDDTVYLYYCGQGEDWTSWPPQNKAEGFPFHTTGCMRLSRMGLATLKRDRFTCLRALDGETPSFAITQPMSLKEGSGLFVNVSGTLAGRSWAAVEIVDAAGKSIPGFSLDECTRLAPDGIRIPVSWGSKSLPDGEVKLKFWIYGQAKLHSYWFE